MTSTKDKSYSAILKDMRSASPEVLRKTARDVFRDKVEKIESSKTAGSINSGNVDNGASSVFDAFSEKDRIPKFEAKELILGKVVGRGSFCCVRECNFSTLSSGSQGSTGSISRFLRRLTHASISQSTREKSDKALSSSCLKGSSDHRSISSERTFSHTPLRFDRKSVNRSRYVMKQLCPNLKESDKMSFLKGTVDLAMETRLLASLDHDHIVRLEAVSACDPFSDGYFIVLERLNETLSKKVKEWMDLDRQCKGITGVFTGSKSKVQRLESERIAAAYDLAVGMNYLHARNIVFRDLKPDNIGFNYVGVLKLFDFGLAKELNEAERTNDGLYRMTGMTGAIRYMSPENAQGKPYGLSNDVYSWAMIMWFVLALEPPFASYTNSMIHDRVCNRGYRPKLFSSWSPRMTELISRSWAENPRERPSFGNIAETLKEEMADVNPKLAAMVENSSELNVRGS